MRARDEWRAGARPLVIGHRGARGHAPENTMAAFNRGIELGADLVECDVHLSADGQVVVIHDDKLDRTTSGKGEVRHFDAASITALDAGQGERVPTLDRLLGWLAQRTPAGVIIEIKNGPNFYPGIASAIGRLLERHQMCGRAMVISFDHWVIREFSQAFPVVASGILYHARLVDPVAAALAAGASSVWPSLSQLTPEVVSSVHAAGIAAFTWTANTAADFDRALAAQVDGIGTDFPDRLVTRLGGRSG